MFLNIYTAPVFWFLIAPIILVPFLPLMVLACCWGIGALCMTLYRTRSRKSKVDWKNEIVVITGGIFLS